MRQKEHTNKHTRDVGCTWKETCDSKRRWKQTHSMEPRGRKHGNLNTSRTKSLIQNVGLCGRYKVAWKALVNFQAETMRKENTRGEKRILKKSPWRGRAVITAVLPCDFSIFIKTCEGRMSVVCSEFVTVLLMSATNQGTDEYLLVPGVSFRTL